MVYQSTLHQPDLRLTLLYGSMSFLMVPLLRKALVSEEPLLHASTQHHQYRVLNCLSSSHVAQPVVRSPSLSSLSLCCVLFHHQWSKVQTDNFPLTHRLPSPTTTSRSVQGGPMYKAPSNESYSINSPRFTLLLVLKQNKKTVSQKEVLKQQGLT
ncbi:hypothetical protein YC2023_077023 [Brassica napus]